MGKKVVLIGKRSNLSKQIYNKLVDCELISISDVLKDRLSFTKEHSYVFILNNFYKSNKLSNKLIPNEYVDNSIVSTSKLLNFILNEDLNVEKIIYTSSSSVYGNLGFCSENVSPKVLNLHSSMKLANENLVKTFCVENSIDYTITRIFNMYGGDDEFSVISKILSAVVNNDKIVINNNGNAVRDFININDVVNIYLYLLNLKNLPILNIGTSNGIKIKDIVQFIKSKGHRLDIQKKYNKEIDVSVADVSLLKSRIKDISFSSLYDFLNSELDGIKIE